MRKRENIWMIWTTDYLQLEVDSMNCKKTVVENQDKPVKITINVSFLLAKISKTFIVLLLERAFFKVSILRLKTYHFYTIKSKY